MNTTLSLKRENKFYSAFVTGRDNYRLSIYNAHQSRTYFLKIAFIPMDLNIYKHKTIYDADKTDLSINKIYQTKNMEH